MLLGAVLLGAGWVTYGPDLPALPPWLGGRAPRDTGTPAAYETIAYRVSAVIDGDTLDLVPAGDRRAAPVRVRLLNINTPERRQRGWGEAKAALERLVRGREVSLRFAEPGQRAAGDRYDRVLAYVFVGDVNANVELVRQGWSPYWTRYGEGRFPREFRDAEADARAKRRGLWAAE